MTANNVINTYNESPLHAALKAYIAQPGDNFEATVDGFIIDVQRGDLLIEVQTRSFAAIKAKLRKLTKEHQVQLVFPIAVTKWIVRPSKGEDPSSKISRRKSPKQGSSLNIFSELVSIPKLINNPNFTIEILYTHEEEVRHWVGHQAWRRRGWATQHRILLEVVDREVFTCPQDFAAMLPEKLPGSFTKNELAALCNCGKRLAGQMAYCLRKMDVIEQVGKRGNAYLYEVTGVTG